MEGTVWHCALMTTDAGGHVFVVNGDLTTLACDAILLPQDDKERVSWYWFDLFEDAGAPAEGYRRLPAGTRVKSRQHGTAPSTPVIERVNTVSDSDIDAMVEKVQCAIEKLGHGRGGRSESGRAVPLVAFPLPGTGAGLFRSARGEVIRRLMASLAASASGWNFDVALVLKRRSDFTAVQSVRHGSAWSALSADELGEADRLGALAAAGELSLFVGAGVSQALGLPGWTDLVDGLLSAAYESAEEEKPTGSDLLRLADDARERLNAGGTSDFEAHLRAALATDDAALSHALLAGLGLQRTVTTNFDRAFEIAHEGAYPGALRVMAATWPSTDRPWLLKLHGDLETPDSIVLTESQYLEDKDRQPLYGLVQGLLMTSHLLFVGFSLTDSAFVRLANDVDQLFESAGSPGSHKLATVLSLEPLDGETGWRPTRSDAVSRIVMGAAGEGTIAAHARRLEIFLDRLAWKAARSGEDAMGHFLAREYDGLVEDSEHPLRAALLDLAASVSGLGPEDDTRARITSLLHSMGYSESTPPR